MTAIDPARPAESANGHDGGEIVLSVRDLVTHFPVRNGVVKAVDGVSFDIVRGRTLAIVGESGSGKSVTARSILQIVEAPGRIVSGSMAFFRADGSGVDLARLRPKGGEIRAIRGQEIAMIFQEPMSSLSPVHTIGDQIDEVLRLHWRLGKKAARERTVDLLRQVEIPDPAKAAERYTFEFSGGMRQRAMIAMALACNPSLLIADEPTTALDVTTQAEILDLIKRLQESHGMGVMFITHDMGVVAEIADDVLVMYNGKVMERGPVEQIFHEPVDSYTRMLIGSVVKLEGKAEIRVGRSEVTADVPPILEAIGLKKYFPTQRRRHQGGRRRIARWCVPARRWAWSASSARARPPWAAACCASTTPPQARSAIAAPTAASSTSPARTRRR